MHNLYYLEKLAEDHATQPPVEDRDRGVTDPEERQRELEGRGEPVRLARARLGRMLIRLGTRIAA